MSDANDLFTIRPLAYRPYSIRHDNLLQEGSQLWHQARTRVKVLLEHAPRATDALQTPTTTVQALEQALKQRWIDYWNARAPHTALSRRAVAEQAFLDHLQAAARLAYYHGQLSRTQLLPLLTLLEGASKLGSQLIYVETLALRTDQGTKLKAGGALVVTLDSDAPVTQLLYLPSHDPALQAFADRQALQTYLMQNRSQVWPHATLQSDVAVELSYQPGQLASACKQWLSHCRSRYLEQAHLLRASSAAPEGTNHEATGLAASEPPFAHLTAFDPPDPTLWSDPFPAFGSLSPDIPQSHRWAEVKRQHQAMLDLLGDDLRAGNDSPGWARLKALRTALSNAQERASVAAAGLLSAQKLEDLYRLRYLPNVHYSALYQARLDGLHAELALQRALGLLTAPQAQLMHAVLAHPQAGKRDAAAGMACALSLSISSVTATGTITQVQELHGVAAFMHRESLQGTGFVLVYWPGLGGGLEAFASRAQLERSLLRLGAPATGAAITLNVSPVAGDIFDYGLQGQLHACEQQAGESIEQLPVGTHQRQRLEALQQLTTLTYEQLLVPVHAARDRAYVQLTEEGFSESLESGLPSWLKTLRADERVRLKSLISDYIRAVRASQRQLERDLPDLDHYANTLLQQRLRMDFSLTDEVQVLIDVPDRLIHRKEPVAGSGAPGTPQQTVATPGPMRTWPLAALAQHNIDADMRQRLGFMRVRVNGADAVECARVSAGIDLKYLRRTVRELDLAQACEDKIRQAFLGRAQHSAYAQAHQRECLLEPMRLMLHMHSEYARLQGSITRSGHTLALLASDAGTASSFQSGGRDVQLLPARLMVGGSDTHGLPTTLSAVTFIHDRNGGQTLLYLPDAPDQRCLREYPSLEEARLGLFNLTFDNKMVDYLADRAIAGSIASHKARIDQAGVRRFDGLIGIGLAWPATTSLASHLLDAHMGRLVEAQRRHGRSNDALYLQRAALTHGKVFDYLKMAFGMLPFVGTAVALFDAWSAANAAVGALRAGEYGESVNQLEALLVALIDAVIDSLPGAVHAPGGSRLLARSRQWSMLARRAGAPGTTTSLPTGMPDPFAGYQYRLPLDLGELQPGSHGLYRGVYRHAQGDFILRDGLPYQVALHTSPQTWRLHATSSKTYPQPIALDSTGRWQTHGALYGTLIKDGLAGGGGVLGYLGHRAADGLQPLWPAAIRERLPRWLVDRQYRRHFELSSSIDQQNKALREQMSRHESLIMEQAADPRQRANAEAACASDIARAEALYLLLQEHESYVSRDFLKRNRRFQSELAYIVAGRRINQANLARRSINELNEALGHTVTPGELLALPESNMLELRRTRLALDQQFGLMEQRLQHAQAWAERVTERADRAHLRETLDAVAFVDLAIARASNLTQLAHRTAEAHDVAQMFHLLDTKAMRDRFQHGLESHFRLPGTTAGLRERQHVLRSSRQIYIDYRNQMNIWIRNRPDRFEHEHVERLTHSLDRLIEHADRMMPQLNSNHPKPKQSGQPARGVFETHEHDFFIGDESRAADGEQIFTLTGSGNRIETYRRVGSQWRLQEDPSAGALPTPSRPLAELVAEGQAWLDATPAHERRVQRYAIPGETPANLEDLMVNQGRQLELRARVIEQQTATHPLAERLRARAKELRAKGRALRIQQAMGSQTPTEGYLDYLMDQHQVDIVRLGDRTSIGTERLSADFLQEYVIRDISVQPPVTLWYAHFHYRRERAAFEQFDKAHIKRPEQRLLGLRWQQEQGAEAQRIWRGPIGKPLAIKLFAGLQA